MTRDGFHGMGADVAYLSEVFSFFHLRYVYLDKGDSYRLECVEDSNACMGIGGGIYDDPVCVSVSLLYFVDKCTLVV